MWCSFTAGVLSWIRLEDDIVELLRQRLGNGDTALPLLIVSFLDTRENF